MQTTNHDVFASVLTKELERRRWLLLLKQPVPHNPISNNQIREVLAFGLPGRALIVGAHVAPRPALIFLVGRGSDTRRRSMEECGFGRIGRQRTRCFWGR